jgi:tRNA(fMet)-specific endonuclease VapC
MWPYTMAAAEVFGQLCAHLRRTGRQMPRIDVQIAAIALTLGNCTVVTKDSDFRAIPGLRRLSKNNLDVSGTIAAL